jgi:hypothetical protein
VLHPLRAERIAGYALAIVVGGRDGLQHRMSPRSCTKHGTTR